MYKCIHEIFGYNTAKNMIKIDAENYDYIIHGYISNLNISKSNRNYMITLVNIPWPATNLSAWLTLTVRCVVSTACKLDKCPLSNASA